MKLKTLAIASITLVYYFSSASFANEGFTKNNLTNIRKENKTFSNNSNNVRKFIFNDYIKKTSKDSRVDARYMDFPNQRVGYNKLMAGSKLISHNHDTDQSGYIIKGEAELEFGPKKTKVTIKEGDSFFIPRLVQHELTAITDIEMLTFNPGTVANESSNFKH